MDYDVLLFGNREVINKEKKVLSLLENCGSRDTKVNDVSLNIRFKLNFLK